MRPTFGCEYIKNEFQRIGAGVSEPLTVTSLPTRSRT